MDRDLHGDLPGGFQVSEQAADATVSTRPDETHAELASHPTEGQYVRVALFLAVLTGIEVGVYYVSGLKSVLIPILLILMVLKFAMVALWFMHLRFDSELFRRLFVTGITVAVAVYTAALFSLHVLS
jgi:cytochrome c oxidase subunit 4